MSKDFNIWLQFLLLFLSGSSFYIAGYYDHKDDLVFPIVFGIVLGIVLMVSASNL